MSVLLSTQTAYSPFSPHTPTPCSSSLSSPHSVKDSGHGLTRIMRMGIPKPGTTRGPRLRQSLNSPSFGPDLLPGMYSTPVLAVPKPHSDKLRLVSHQSCGLFSQNSMINKDLTRGPRMDTLHQFLPALLHFRRTHGNVRLVLWKSDVSEAFRHHPAHPLWQIKQVVTTNIPTKDDVDCGIECGPLIRNVDGRSCFGSCASPRNWASIMGLIIWVAVFIKMILDLVRAIPVLLPDETDKISPTSR